VIRRVARIFVIAAGLACILPAAPAAAQASPETRAFLDCYVDEHPSSAAEATFFYKAERYFDLSGRKAFDKGACLTKYGGQSTTSSTLDALRLRHYTKAAKCMVASRPEFLRDIDAINANYNRAKINGSDADSFLPRGFRFLARQCGVLYEHPSFRNVPPNALERLGRSIDHDILGRISVMRQNPS
tara:strand:- start:982 stop:1539 length:558 start_codon:yes stop_codon:yes gene_type:complete